jgi:anti-sigma-K factor RskA
VNVQEYIESGIIESYVMGLASESERAEFERMCREYPEVLAARRKFEESLESYAASNATPPPPEIRAKVLKAITMNNQEKPVRDPQPVRSIGLLRLVAAAAILLLIGAVVLYYRTKEENQDLAGANDRLRTALDSTQRDLNKIADEQKKVVGNPNVTVVNMVGTQVAPKSSANIYWDSASSNVYLVVKNMPTLPSDQQYQLWALIDNKPKDLGVFDATDPNVILKMKNTQKAQAFAITIEKKGGSPSPDLQKLQSMGKTLQTQ